jgi:hypothetical protein
MVSEKSDQRAIITIKKLNKVQLFLFMLLLAISDTKGRVNIQLKHLTHLMDRIPEGNKRAVQFRKMWSWFVLLEIEGAFTKLTFKASAPDVPSKDPDYRVMALWLSQFGIDAIEALFAKFYMNKRLTYIKEQAGIDWQNAIMRFIFGSLNEQSKRIKPGSVKYETYKPRRGVRNPDEEDEPDAQLSLPGTVRQDG